jgi:hypothetical protein
MIRYLLAFCLGFALAGSFIAIKKAYSSSLVSMFEARFGGPPGTTRVIPECGCTMKYVGTRIEGTDYFVHFKKLD